MSFLSHPRFQALSYALLRVIAGLMIMQHGLQKHFGLLGGFGPTGGRVAPISQNGLGGAIELIGGALLALGLFAQPAAFILSGMMAVAYFQVHAPHGFFPIVNRGELAVLYCFVFLFFSAHGAGAYSLDGMRWAPGARDNAQKR
jgi:putative oxidoreductase